MRQRIEERGREEMYNRRGRRAAQAAAQGQPVDLPDPVLSEQGQSTRSNHGEIALTFFTFLSRGGGGTGAGVSPHFGEARADRTARTRTCWRGKLS